ncbi:MAG: histidine ammonia-lyase, partial [Acidobacteria bacterium]|nr:histidine ammonia-lyase [Acidobacteriota bacterium]
MDPLWLLKSSCRSQDTGSESSFTRRPWSASRGAAECSRRRSGRTKSCTVLNDEQVKQFQRFLIYNHAAGIGDPVPVEQVRAAIASRINVHSRGYSGCRPDITHTLVDMLNKGVTPVVCRKGSVGASGDLAPMSQIALLLMGEGEAFHNGERLPGMEAMTRAGIPVPGLQARDGLATINGSNLLTAMSALQLYDIDRWLRQAEIACAMTLESLCANLKPYDVRLHQLRGFPGAVRSAT